jgi:RNA polymerase sigma-70 factor (ECF subfamily)
MDEKVSEQALIKRLVKGEQSAYKELIEMIEKPLVNFIYRYVGERSEAEDIFQDTFVRVLQTIRGYRPKAKLSTWIFTIARNLCLDHIKSKKRRRTLSLDTVPSPYHDNIIPFEEILQSQSMSVDSQVQKKELELEIEGALQRLPLKYREALILRVYLDLPYSEVAQIAQAPVGTVKYRVHSAIRILSRMLQEGSKREEASL